MFISRKKRSLNFKKSKISIRKLNKLAAPLVITAVPIYSVDSEQKIKNNSQQGCTCKKCGNFNDYAEANQHDGSFVCFSCR